LQKRPVILRSLLIEATPYLCMQCYSLLHSYAHCHTLQHAATHCNTLQHTATHWNTLQHTATHLNCVSVYATLLITTFICVTGRYTDAVQLCEECTDSDMILIGRLIIDVSLAASHYIWLQHTTTRCNARCNTHYNTQKRSRYDSDR